VQQLRNVLCIPAVLHCALVQDLSEAMLREKAAAEAQWKATMDPRILKKKEDRELNRMAKFKQVLIIAITK
jgi:hypothetical protein